MKRRKVLFLIIVILLLLFITLLKSMLNTSTTYSDVLENNWGISLSNESNYKEIYEKNSSVSFLGDGIRYHIFSYDEEKYISIMFDWNDKEGKTIYNLSYSDASNQWLKEIDVPKKYYPNYDKCFYWYKSKEDNSEIIVFWDNTKNEIYIVESFM